jgi:hypothetical protein
MGQQDKQEPQDLSRDPFSTHNDDDKMVYEFKNSENDPNRELTEDEVEAQFRERTGQTENDETASTKSSTKTTATKPTSTPKEK